MKIQTRRLIPVALATALLAACATTPPQPLQGQFTAITPSQALDRDATNALVRWGGRIVAVEPGQNRTCFEMLSTGLDGTGRPYWKTDEIGGRFIACRTGFYDPALFEKNREVTFTGRVDGYENRQIGGYDYRFPRMAADVVYLWPQREYVDVMTRPGPWPWWGYW